MRAEGSLRVALVSREHPAFGASGGIGTCTQLLADGLAARGHRVTVLALGRGGPSSPPPHPALLGVQASQAWAPPGLGSRLGMAARTVPFALAAARALRQAGPFDVVEVPEYQGWGLGVALTAACPVVVRLHGHTALVRRQNGDPIDLDTRLCSALEAATLQRGARVLVGSASLAAEARRDFRSVLSRRPLDLVPLGVDTARFRPQPTLPARAVLGLPASAPVLLYVGRLEVRKGVETLLEAYIRVRARHPDALLVMAGAEPPPGPRPPLRERLLARARAAGVADGLRLLGAVPHAALPTLYAACDVFVAPSAAEPFGLVFLEAMACGRPVVGCRAGGVPEIVQEGRTGWLVPPHDDEALAARLADALLHPTWCAEVGAEARTVAEERHAVAVLAARTEAAYREVLQAGLRPASAGGRERAA